MDPKTIYFSVLITVMIMVAAGCYAHWWYDHYVTLKAWRTRYAVCRDLDNALLMHKVNFVGVLFALVALTIFVWFIQ